MSDSHGYLMRPGAGNQNRRCEALEIALDRRAGAAPLAVVPHPRVGEKFRPASLHTVDS